MSVTEPSPDKSRKGLYRIADPFLATWFALVHPHRDELERGPVDEVMESRILPRLHGYVSLAVEPGFRELLSNGFAADLVPCRAAHRGRHWSPTAEQGMVLLDEARQHAFVAEVKWGRERVSSTLLDDLRERVAREPVFQGMSCTFALVRVSGFSGHRKLASDERPVDLSPGAPAGRSRRAPGGVRSTGRRSQELWAARCHA